ncbi:BglG family transcription antiterminator LicT [Serratia symbiotica]|uniref:PRD domain-containing protein n=1 Tax=Serratia symbiotica TaxID=138074 RepID=A0A068YWP1_9GAMM|nr:PRD domain-containing protein [Serratia symbiotica]MBF1996563.1 PRD domain-containing protein [Serratia symbiotica]MBQ0955882.1 PRD domain-containing protein [Serratia symbiotica]QLH62198.1 PRD domain-containing protein [Serratia symbiotica]QTP15103.1 PRD domain-containing protein [Serratia symbiotica]CDS55805.1 Beta-glucoside operon antiterminator [Serratia symbiotica]
MKIAKILNNNVVITLDEHQKEKVVMGCGIGFKKKAGDRLDESLIEKVFTLNNSELSERYKALLAEIPLACVTTADQIITLARQHLPGELHNIIYITLTDHIHFALQRHAQGLDIKNALLWEIKKLYPAEFAVGLQALTLIAQRLEATLPEDEAGFIALHFVNAQLNDEMHNTLHITRVMQEILNIVKYHFCLDYNEEALSYHRFVTHLKFFAQRLLGKNDIDSNDDSLYQAVKEQYPASFICAGKINQHIEKNYQHQLTTEEIMFLTIHIEQVRSKN